jgi:hypothetical protein
MITNARILRWLVVFGQIAKAIQFVILALWALLVVVIEMGINGIPDIFRLLNPLTSFTAEALRALNEQIYNASPDHVQWMAISASLTFVTFATGWPLVLLQALVRVPANSKIESIGRESVAIWERAYISRFQIGGSILWSLQNTATEGVSNNDTARNAFPLANATSDGAGYCYADIVVKSLVDASSSRGGRKQVFVELIGVTIIIIAVTSMVVGSIVALPKPLVALLAINIGIWWTTLVGVFVLICVSCAMHWETLVRGQMWSIWES